MVVVSKIGLVGMIVSGSVVCRMVCISPVGVSVGGPSVDDAASVDDAVSVSDEASAVSPEGSPAVVSPDSPVRVSDVSSARSSVGVSVESFSAVYHSG